MAQDLDKEIENTMVFHKLVQLPKIRCIIDLKDYLAHILIL